MKSLLKLAVPFFLTLSVSYSQFSEDIQRYSSNEELIGARSLGMGGAYTSIADDYSAIYWNPAGLGQLRRLELSLGISNRAKHNDFTYLGNANQSDVSSTLLNNVSFVLPFPTVQGSLVFALSYHGTQDFNSQMDFGGYNDKSSIIPSLYDTDIPFYTRLSTLNNSTVIYNNVYQTGSFKESGTAGKWSFAGAVEIDKDVYAGLTLNVYKGSYKSERYFTEYDSKGLHVNTPLTDTVKSRINPNQDSAYVLLFRTFNQFSFQEIINSDVSASPLVFGMLFRASDDLRFGLRVQFPYTITVSEKYSNDGKSVLDTSKVYRDGFDATNDYGIKTPWSFGFGGSYFLQDNLLVSADLDYTDWTQSQFTDNTQLESHNQDIQSSFRSVVNFRAGAEYGIPKTDVHLRLGFALNPSPYKGDPSSFDKKTITGGIGILLRRNVMIDAGLAWNKVNAKVLQYADPSSRLDEKFTNTQALVTLSYRF